MAIKLFENLRSKKMKGGDWFTVNQNRNPLAPPEENLKTPTSHTFREQGVNGLSQTRARDYSFNRDGNAPDYSPASYVESNERVATSPLESSRKRSSSRRRNEPTMAEPETDGDYRFTPSPIRHSRQTSMPFPQDVGSRVTLVSREEEHVSTKQVYTSPSYRYAHPLQQQGSDRTNSEQAHSSSPQQRYIPRCTSPVSTALIGGTTIGGTTVGGATNVTILNHPTVTLGKPVSLREAPKYRYADNSPSYLPEQNQQSLIADSHRYASHYPIRRDDSGLTSLMSAESPSHYHCASQQSNLETVMMMSSLKSVDSLTRMKSEGETVKNGRQMNISFMPSFMPNDKTTFVVEKPELFKSTNEQNNSSVCKKLSDNNNCSSKAEESFKKIVEDWKHFRAFVAQIETDLFHWFVRERETFSTKVLAKELKAYLSSPIMMSTKSPVDHAVQPAETLSGSGDLRMISEGGPITGRVVSNSSVPQSAGDWRRQTDPTNDLSNAEETGYKKEKERDRVQETARDEYRDVFGVGDSSVGLSRQNSSPVDDRLELKQSMSHGQLFENESNIHGASLRRMEVVGPEGENGGRAEDSKREGDDLDRLKSERRQISAPVLGHTRQKSLPELQAANQRALELMNSNFTENYSPEQLRLLKEKLTGGTVDADSLRNHMDEVASQISESSTTQRDFHNTERQTETGNEKNDIKNQPVTEHRITEQRMAEQRMTEQPMERELLKERLNGVLANKVHNDANVEKTEFEESLGKSDLWSNSSASSIRSLMMTMRGEDGGMVNRQIDVLRIEEDNGEMKADFSENVMEPVECANLIRFVENGYDVNEDGLVEGLLRVCAGPYEAGVLKNELDSSTEMINFVHDQQKLNCQKYVDSILKRIESIVCSDHEVGHAGLSRDLSRSTRRCIYAAVERVSHVEVQEWRHGPSKVSAVSILNLSPFKLEFHAGNNSSWIPAPGGFLLSLSTGTENALITQDRIFSIKTNDPVYHILRVLFE